MSSAPENRKEYIRSAVRQWRKEQNQAGLIPFTGYADSDDVDIIRKYFDLDKRGGKSLAVKHAFAALARELREEN